MSKRTEKVLIIGFGNPGRRDDGLGPAFSEIFESIDDPDITTDADYQLTVEDAAHIARHDVVVFVDADAVGPEPYSFQEVTPKSSLSFSSHSIEPEAVLALAHELFDSQAKGYILGIRGYEFDVFNESLTEKASSNLKAAVDFFKTCLRLFS